MANFMHNTLVKSVVHGDQADAGDCNNVFTWWLYSVNPFGVLDTVLLASIKAHVLSLWDDIKAQVPSSTKWLSVETWAKPLGITDWQLVGTDALNVAGLASADPLPSGISPVVTGPTSKAKRRARKFLPAFNESSTGYQKWTVTALAAIAAFGARWLLGFWGELLTTYLYPIALKAIDNTWTALRAVDVPVTPAYQRRRKPGEGS